MCNNGDMFQEVLQYMEKTFGYLLSPADSGNPASVKEQLATPAETESLLNSAKPILTRTFSEEGLEEEALSLGELDIEPSHAMMSQGKGFFLQWTWSRCCTSIDLASSYWQGTWRPASKRLNLHRTFPRSICLHFSSRHSWSIHKEITTKLLSSLQPIAAAVREGNQEAWMGCFYQTLVASIIVSGKSRLLLFTSQKLCILSLVHISANPNQYPNFLKTSH